MRQYIPTGNKYVLLLLIKFMQEKRVLLASAQICISFNASRAETWLNYAFALTVHGMFVSCTGLSRNDQRFGPDLTAMRYLVPRSATTLGSVLHLVNDLVCAWNRW